MNRTTKLLLTIAFAVGLAAIGIQFVSAIVRTWDAVQSVRRLDEGTRVEILMTRRRGFTKERTDMGLWIFDAKSNAALGIIDQYSRLNSMRRYDAPGEIEFTAPLTPLDDSSRLSPGQIVWPQHSDEAYILDTVTLTRRHGGAEATAKGRSLTALLERRCLPDVTYYTGTAGFIIRKMTEDVFGDAARAFPGWSMTQADGLGETAAYLTSGETLLEAVRIICGGSGLGVRTAFEPASCAMRLELYEGADRFDEDALDPAALDPEYDNFMELTAVDSSEGFVNVMYVIGEADATGVTKKIAVDNQLEHTGTRASGLDRFERAVRYAAASVTDGSGSAIGKPPGSGGGSSQLTNTQYTGTLKAFALNEMRACARGVTVSGTIEQGERIGSELTLGDIVRVRARRWGVDTAARVRALEVRYDRGVITRRAALGRI
ncbi:MAG: siphovirus ReqiPepy6 Gp37-like family protein [Oscillospiraceae bacterium]|nr:siphovirus ReqiPepy6 Gp37-like family protein [Oscillospiraceae bacterium]